jgi:hypothetical protein
MSRQRSSPIDIRQGLARLWLLSLDEGDREACLRRIRQRLAGSGDEPYIYSGEVVMAIAQTPAVAEHTLGEDDG